MRYAFSRSVRRSRAVTGQKLLLPRAAEASLERLKAAQAETAASWHALTWSNVWPRSFLLTVERRRRAHRHREQTSAL